jgi:hypothetical protein
MVRRFPPPLHDPASHPISRLARHRLAFWGSGCSSAALSNEGKSVADHLIAN